MKQLSPCIDEDAPTDVFVREREPVPVPEPARETLWDVNDVARYLKVSRSWVYHRAEAGQLPLRRIGGLLRFDPAAVKAFAVGDRAIGGPIRKGSSRRDER